MRDLLTVLIKGFACIVAGIFALLLMACVTVLAPLYLIYYLVWNGYWFYSFVTITLMTTYVMVVDFYFAKLINTIDLIKAKIGFAGDGNNKTNLTRGQDEMDI